MTLLLEHDVSTFFKLSKIIIQFSEGCVTYVLAEFQWCETQKDCNRLRLMDIVVQPMQRLTKYSLLLKAIHRNTENKEHRDSLTAMVSLW
jgi:hypothetical protein